MKYCIKNVVYEYYKESITYTGGFIFIYIHKEVMYIAVYAYGAK